MSDLAEAIYIQQLSGSGAGINPVTGRIEVGGIVWLLRAAQPVGPVKTIAARIASTEVCPAHPPSTSTATGGFGLTHVRHPTIEPAGWLGRPGPACGHRPTR